MGAGRAVRVICMGVALGATAASSAGPEPRDAGPQWERAVALEREGHCEEAIGAYRAAAEQGHPESAALTRIAACHQRLARQANTPAALRLDHRLRAAGALSRAIRLDPANREALGRLGDLALEAGDPDGALVVYRHLEALAPEEPLTRLRLGRAHAQRGDPEQALAEFRRASERVEGMSPRDPQATALRSELASLAHLGAAESLIALGRRDAARGELNRVLEATAGVELDPVGAERARARTRAMLLLGAIEAGTAPAAAAD